MTKPCIIVLPSYAVGGAEVHTIHVANLLAKEGYQPEILCAEGVVADFVRSRGLSPKTVHGKGKRKILPKIALRLMLDRPEIVIVVLPWPDRIWVLSLLPKRSHAIAIVHCMPAIMGQRWRRKRFPEFQKRMWNRFNRIITVSESLAQPILDEVAVPASTVHTVHNPAWLPDGVARCNPAQTPQLLYVGRLDTEKNLAVVLQALSTIKSLPWHFTIAGDGEDRQRLEKIVCDCSLSERVTFVGQCDPWPLYAASDLLIFPSYKEAMPLVPPEAMIAGMAVLVADCPALRSVFSTELLLWCPPHDHKDWAAAISNALGDRDALRHRGESSVGYAEENFSQKPWATKILKAMGLSHKPSSSHA